MCLLGDRNIGFHSKPCITPQCTLQKGLQPSLLNELHREFGTDKLWLLGHAQTFVPFLIPRIASSSGAALPGNPHFPLPGETLAAVAAVAALTSIAGVLCDPAQLQSPPLAFILCCDNGTAEELVLSATLSYFQNSSIGACVLWSQHYDGFDAL